MILETAHPDVPPIDRLRAIMHRLRAPGGCPWDQEQSHQSLIPNLIEEAYETAAAIRSGDSVHLQEELGDLLLQVVFHGELGSETGAFDFDSICTGIADKLVRRHPHVFGDAEAATTAEVLRQWDAIKAAEKGPDAVRRGYLDGIGTGFPALLRAKELQKRAAKVGFDWDAAAPVLEKVREEVEEVAAELAASSGPDRTKLEEEVGDLLFTVVNLARKLGLDAESALDAANGKFVRRFHRIEDELRAAGRELADSSLAELDAAWERTKLAPPEGH